MTTKMQRYTADERRVQAEQLHESIADQVAALTDSVQWRRFLDFMGGFHAYSLNNVLLILSQFPAASRVAGFRAWQEKGRQVRKGERGIRIFGYSARKITDESGEVELDDDGNPKTRATFPILSVFDIGQTDPIDPDEDEPWNIVNRLDGDDEAGVYATIRAYLEGKGWTVEDDEISGERNGYTDPEARRVVIDSRLSPAQRAKTALHEAGHILLGHVEDLADYLEHRGVKECEAESVAYVVAGLLGIDTSAHSVGYVAGWVNGDVEAIRATATNVLQAVHTLAEVLIGADKDEGAGPRLRPGTESET